MRNFLFIRASAVLVLGVLVQGCVLSLHPLFTKETLVFKPELLGTWSDDDNTWQFQRLGEKSYTLIYTDGNEEKGKFTAALVGIDDKLFLDLYPGDPADQGSAYWKFHFLKAHTFLHVQELGPKLKMRAMNPDWMQKHLEKNPDAIEATIIEKRPVLTASSQKLQSFISKLADLKPAAGEKEGPFGKPTDLTKKE